MEDLKEEIKKLKSEYLKEWRKKNPDKVKEINNRYWLNKAKKNLEEKEKED